MRPLERLLRHFFDLRVIVGDCDLEAEVGRFQPTGLIFNGGIETLDGTPPQRIRGLDEERQLPRAGLLLSDLYGPSRVRSVQHLRRCRVEVFFSICDFRANGIEGLRERSFLLPWWLDEAVYRDYPEERWIPLGLYGAGFIDGRKHYPWRREIADALSGRIALFSAMRPDAMNSTPIQGEDYARLLNRTLITAADGAVCDIFTRKHLEICACGSLLLCKDTPIVRGMGFIDGENCVFADRDTALEKVEALLGNRRELQRIARNGQHLVREFHTLRRRRQIFDWFQLRWAHGQGVRCHQPHPWGGLELATDPGAEETTAWSVRNAYEQSLDRVFEAIRAFDLRKSFEEVKEIRRYFTYPCEVGLGQALVYLLSGQAEEAIEDVLRLTENDCRRYGALVPDPIHLGVLVLALLLFGRLDEARRRLEKDRVPDSPLHRVLGEWLQLPPLEARGEGAVPVATIHFRMNGDAFFWQKFIEQCVAARRQALACSA